MAKSVDKIVKEIRELPDIEKLRLVDAILTDLDKPDPEIDRVWAAYKAGKVPTVSYESVMAKHRDRESKFSHPGTRKEKGVGSLLLLK